MKNLSDDEITQDEINKFVTEKSDFAFELQVLKRLNELGFQCQHSGTYTDPNTSKTREFDIRASKDIEQWGGSSSTRFQIRLAVECKSIGKNHPLLLYCTNRTQQERYINIVESRPLGFRGSTRKETKESPYLARNLVAKSCDQVGKHKGTGAIIGNDSSVFDKISQAINSSSDLVLSSLQQPSHGQRTISCVIPVLVIPNDRMWMVQFDADGSLVDTPQLSPNSEYYVDKNVTHTGYDEFNISHLEIIQIGALEKILEKYDAITFMEPDK